MSGKSAAQGALVPRSFWMVALAYLATATAIFATMGLFTMTLSVFDHSGMQYRKGGALLLSVATVSVGGIIATFILQCLFVTPLLLVFRRYRWRWVNTMIVILLGAICGVAIMSPFVFLILNSGAASKDPLFVSAMIAMIFGMGAVAGAAGGTAFRFIALRRDNPAKAFD